MRPYQICSNCVMDTSDAQIVFDERGVCDHCNGFKKDVLPNWYPNDQGKAMFMCTHDIFRAKELADRVGIMKEGRLVMLRTREEFLEDDLEKVYLDYMQEAVVV